MAHTLSYPPVRRIGAELATHALLEHLQDSGWESIAVPRQEPGAAAERVDHVWRCGGLLASGSNPDVILTHAPLQDAARRQSARSGAPIVMTAHGGPPGWVASQIRISDPAMVIVNSDAMRVGAERAGRRVQVLHPPVWIDDHLVGKFGAEGDGAAVTLVNGSPDKGGSLVAEMARRMPSIPFLIVEGGYGKTVPALRQQPNVTIFPHGEMSMRDVWDRTRVLLMPSLEESWGMVAVEAMINGIPAIGSTAAGLSECLGPGMSKIRREDLSMWAEEIASAYDGPRRDELHIAALRRAVELQPATQLRAIDRALSGLIGRGVRMGETYCNVRTGQVVDAEPGTRLYARITAAPLVWHPVISADPPGTRTRSGVGDHSPESSAPDPASDADPSWEPPARPEPPKRTASKSAWVEYAVSRGADRSAATAAMKAALIALYG